MFSVLEVFEEEDFWYFFIWFCCPPFLIIFLRIYNLRPTKSMTTTDARSRHILNWWIICTNERSYVHQQRRVTKKMKWDETTRKGVNEWKKSWSVYLYTYICGISNKNNRTHRHTHTHIELSIRIMNKPHKLYNQ